MVDANCLFCKIASKEIPAPVIYEDEHTIAFLDIAPRATGHTLVISKEHAPTIVGLSANGLQTLFRAVQKVDAHLVERLTPDGMTVGINQGRASGQEVDHLHVHLMPRWSDDKGGSIQSVVNNRPGMTVEEVKNKILGQ